ncbi:MAG: hypothetical protein R3C28_20180, partial [Pirellulaceae bacterium]
MPENKPENQELKGKMMNRFRILTVVIFSMTVSGMAANSWAGCGGAKKYVKAAVRIHNHLARTTSHVHTTHVVRPVHVQQTLIRQPVVEKMVQPVVQIAAAPVEPQYPEVPAGATLTLPANFLGEQAGSVFMAFQDIKLPVHIQNWTMTSVTITLPPMAIKDAVLIQVDVVRPDGSVAHSQKLRVTAPSPVILHPTAPTSPLPTNAALQSQTPVNDT